MERPVRLLGLLLLGTALELALAPGAALAREDRSLRKGRILFKSRKYYDARLEFQKALRVNNQDPVAHLWLGKTYARTSDLGKAVDHLKIAIELDPGVEEAYRELGAAYI